MRTIVSHLDILRNIAAYVDIRSLSLTHYESDTKKPPQKFHLFLSPFNEKSSNIKSSSIEGT